MDIEWTASADYSNYSALSGAWVLISVGGGWVLYGPNFFNEIRTEGGLYTALDIATAVIEELTANDLPL